MLHMSIIGDCCHQDKNVSAYLEILVLDIIRQKYEYLANIEIHASMLLKIVFVYCICNICVCEE